MVCYRPEDATRWPNLRWSGLERTECEVAVEFEKTSADKYPISFRSETNVYDDDGEIINGAGPLEASADEVGQGESSLYLSNIDILVFGHRVGCACAMDRYCVGLEA